MAPHSSTFAWKIPWTEEPRRLKSMESLRIGHDWATSLSLFTFMHWRRKWQPSTVFLPGESQGQGSLVAAVYGVTQSWTRLKWLSSTRHNSNNKNEQIKFIFFYHNSRKLDVRGYPDSSVRKESSCNAGDSRLTPGSWRSTEEGIGYPLQYSWASLVAHLVKNLPAMWETWVWSLGWEDLLEKGKATHSSILAWRIPWTV